MNKLSTKEQKAVVAALVEGNSLRAVTRMTSVHRTTIMKLLCDLGRACSEHQDKAFRNLKSKRIQCDEIWSFVYAKHTRDALQPRNLHGGTQGRNHRQPGSRAHFDQLRRTAKSHDAHVHAPVHSLDKRLFKKGRKLGSGGGPPLHALQVLPHLPDPAPHASNGSGRFQSRVEPGRSDCSLARRPDS